MDTEKEIKTMKLYHNVERIYKELKEIGYSKTDPLKVEEVSKFDNYHYDGTNAVMDCIKNLGIGSSHKVLDFGSGIGGPARFLVSQTQCEVLAVEIQSDLNETAIDLTSRCGLSDKLKHECGDVLKLDMAGSFDFLVSWLVILHIEDRNTLFTNCHKLLKPGGKFYSEDFFKLSDYDESVSKILHDDVYIPYLPSKEEYIQHLENAGFTDIKFEDLTTSWRTFVNNRYQSFMAAKDRHVRVLGQETYDALLHFYNKIDGLFNKTTNIGGCRIMATKK